MNVDIPIMKSAKKQKNVLWLEIVLGIEQFYANNVKILISQCVMYSIISHIYRPLQGNSCNSLRMASMNASMS